VDSRFWREDELVGLVFKVRRGDKAAGAVESLAVTLPGDRGLQIIGHDRACDAAEEAEGVFQTADKRLGVLPPDDLAVTLALARVAQHRAKQMRPAAFARRLIEMIHAPWPKSICTSLPGPHSSRHTGSSNRVASQRTQRLTD